MARQVPKGLKDLLPGDVKKEREVLEKIRQVFEKAGYGRIITPTFEYFESLEPALSVDLKKQAYRFLNDEGRVMMLRVDHTTPIARVVGNRLSKEKGPFRFYYSGDVFRKKKLTAGEDNQFHQIGVELVGVSGEKGDQEVLELAQKALKAVGLKNFEIHARSVKHLESLPASQKQAFLNQDFVSLQKIPKKDELMAVHHDYYDGLMFEMFVPQLGYLIGNGGRYDHLIGKLGKSRPAVGFAISLGRLILALELQNK